MYRDFKKITQNALLDTGSSLSFIDVNFFRFIKSQIIYKPLSRNVMIKTINATVNFSGCIQVSMHIQGNYFLNHSYITEIGNGEFTVILGFDFLSMFSFSITPGYNVVLYNDMKIPFVSNIQSGQLNSIGCYGGGCKEKDRLLI